MLTLLDKDCILHSLFTATCLSHLSSQNESRRWTDIGHRTTDDGQTWGHRQTDRQWTDIGHRRTDRTDRTDRQVDSEKEKREKENKERTKKERQRIDE